MSEPSSGTYDAIWPRGERNTKPSALAPRHKTLSGKKIALMWDYIFKGDVVMNELIAGLRERYDNIEVVHWDVIGNIHGPNERAVVAALGARLKEMRVDAVFSGMGC